MDFSAYDPSNNGLGGLFFVIAVIAIFALFFVLLWMLIEMVGTSDGRDWVIAWTVVAALAGTIWGGFTLNNNMHQPVPLQEAVSALYGIELSDDERATLLEDAGSILDPEEEFIVAGSILTEATGEPERLTLAYTKGEWVLLVGDAADGQELARK